MTNCIRVCAGSGERAESILCPEACAARQVQPRDLCVVQVRQLVEESTLPLQGLL